MNYIEMSRLNKFSAVSIGWRIMNFWEGMGNYRFVFNVACATDFEITRNTTQITRFDRVIEK